MPPGRTVLLTGLPSAGKTTLGVAAVDRLRAAGHRAEALDGDVVRRSLWPELGLSRADREQNLARISTVAQLLVRNGVTAIVSAIAPYAGSRTAMRSAHAIAGLHFLEVHVCTPLDECRRRDTKGLYARQARGDLVGLTGVDAPYEPPHDPDLRIDTSTETIEQSTERLLSLVCRT